MQLKIPDYSPEQEELFRTYLHIRQFVGLSWDTEQQLASGLLAAADDLRLTPRQIETLREYLKTPCQQLEESCCENCVENTASSSCSTSTEAAPSDRRRS